jgi:hypothetical protein
MYSGIDFSGFVPGIHLKQTQFIGAFIMEV